MAGEIIIPAWNERALNAELDSPDVNVMAMLGGADHKKIEEALGPSAMEAARKTLTKMNREKKRPPVYASDTIPATGYMPGDVGYMRGPLEQSDYEKKKEMHYPLIGETDNFSPLIWNYIVREVTKFAIPHLGDSGIEKVIKQSLDMAHRGAESGVKVNWNHLSPLGAVLTGISRGATEIDILYTGIHPVSGIEMPIYIQRRGEKLPEKLGEVLEENLKFMYVHGKSAYDDNSKLQELFNKDFSEPEMDFITMGDNPEWFQDPIRARGWPVKDSTLIQHNFAKTKDVGQIIDTNGYYTMNVKVDDTTTLPFKVGVYEEADAMPRFTYWLTTAASYRITNPLFRAAKIGAFRLSRDYGQTMCENHYKAASALTRFLTKIIGSPIGYNYNRNDFNYEHLISQN